MSDLARHYSRFGVTDRVLLTGHSHQAWPDVALEGVTEAFADAARLVDDKWSAAQAKADEVRAGFARLLGEPGATIALGANTHELIVRLLSALDLRARPRLVTTTGEFHSLRRQLTRLGEAGIEVVHVAAEPAATLAERVAAEIDDRTAAALVSSVLFSTAAIVGHLGVVAAACAHQGAEFVVDAYHQLGAVPFDGAGLEAAWVVGGGYKYLQLGEGNCFLRLPAHAERLRPVVTGWYAEFGELADSPPGTTVYARGADRFAGATYDPTSHYRGARVFAFFDEQGLTPERLRAVSLRQTGYIAERLEVPGDRAHYGGFVALKTPRAVELRDALRAEAIHTDVRNDVLRIGPAPYVSDEQLAAAMDALTSRLSRRD